MFSLFNSMGDAWTADYLESLHTQEGQVTLKGPVLSESEKQTIETKATKITGANKVTNDLSVKPQQ